MSEVEFRLTADTASARQEVSKFRKEYAEMVQAVERPLRQIDALKGTQESAKKAAAEFYAAKSKVLELKNAMAQAGQPVKELDRELVKAERTLAKTTLEFERQKTRVREQRTELRQAGVDTRNLANEQARLQQEMAKGLAGGRNDLAVAGIRARTVELQKQAEAQRRANIEQARQDLGVNRYRQLQAETAKLRQQYDLLKTSGKLSTKELEIAHQQLNRRIKENERAMRDLNSAQGGDAGAGLSLARGLGGKGAALAGVAGVASVAAAAIAYAQALDPIKKMTAQLKLATDSQREFNIAQAETLKIAQANQAPIEEVIGLYARLAPAMKELGRGQDETLMMIDAVTKSFRISGATATETAAAITQFAQALGSGVLRGDEFNSIAEQAPRLMQALADSLQVNVGALRQMAADGQLTADVIADALIGQLPKLSKEAEELPKTWSGTMTVIKNELTEVARQIDKFSGASNWIVAQLGSVADAISKLNSGELVDFFRDSKESAAGLNNEASILLSRIRDLNNARSRLNRNDPSDTVLFGFKFWSKADFDKKIKELQAQVQELMNQRKKVEEALEPTEQEQQYTKALGDYTKYLTELKGVRDKAIAAAQKHAKDLLTVEKQLNKDLEDARKARQAIEDRFTNLRSPAGESQPNYLSILQLQQQAALALKNGDSLAAKKSAEEALVMLEKLKDSGENMYGYDSLITSLEQVALAVNDIETQALEDKLVGVQTSIALLNQEAEKLKEMPVSVKADEGSIESARSAIEALISKLSTQEIVIPVRVAMPDKLPAAGNTSAQSLLSDLPGYAVGTRSAPPGMAWVGERGPELVRFKGGEQVFTANQSKRMMADFMAPPLPRLPVADSGPSFPHLGSFEFNMGGESVTLYGSQDAFKVLSRTARKFGRTKT